MAGENFIRQEAKQKSTSRNFTCWGIEKERTAAEGHNYKVAGEGTPIETPTFKQRIQIGDTKEKLTSKGRDKPKATGSTSTEMPTVLYKETTEFFQTLRELERE